LDLRKLGRNKVERKKEKKKSWEKVIFFNLVWTKEKIQGKKYFTNELFFLHLKIEN